MNAFPRGSGGVGRPRWSLLLALLATVGTATALAQVVTVPAAHLNHAEGSVAWSPQGDNEWHDVQPRRVLKRGDRLWTDRGSRAEVQAGGHALRLDGQTQLVLENVSENATQLSLTQGSVVLTVTRVNPGDSIELGTPNLAFRARQAGDYRIDVDTKAATTRVVVLSGAGVVYGEKGEVQELRSGQRAGFRERSLAPVKQPAFAATDDFDRWAGARRRGEPTVSMPTVAQAPAEKPATAFVNKGRDIIIAGPASALPGAKQPVAGSVAAATPQFQIKGPPVVALPPAAKAQAIPNVAVTPAAPAAVPLRVTAAASAAPAPAPAPAAPSPAAQAQAQAQAQAPAAAQAAAQAQAEAEAQAKAQARLPERKAVQARRAEDQRRAVAARRAEDTHRHAQEARRAEDARRQAVARREQDQKRLQAKRAEEKRLALQRKEEEKRLAAARAAEVQKLAEARKRHLARLQEQAGREEQTARDAQARRLAQARMAEQEKREEQARQEEQARREESDRRQRQLADQWQRDQERRNQEVWLRQQQAPQQPVRPPPMGVPFRRVS